MVHSYSGRNAHHDTSGRECKLNVNVSTLKFQIKFELKATLCVSRVTLFFKRSNSNNLVFHKVFREEISHQLLNIAQSNLTDIRKYGSRSWNNTYVRT